MNKFLEDNQHWLNFIVIVLLIIIILFIITPYLFRIFYFFESKNKFKNLPSSSQIRLIYELNDAVKFLAKNKVGAIITITKKKNLDNFRTDGTLIDSKISSALILSIFKKNSPLHDGAIIIEKDRIKYAATYFKISSKSSINKGSRHRAALGISETTDSVTIVVSEERGIVSIAHLGRLYDVKIDDFPEKLNLLLLN
ncbi:MAG: diadenylate cyclase [Mycoplasma sp.]|nr:diadenylate cyclase [Mycoplasma sp.]